MSRNFEESRRKSWKKLRQWGNATPFTIKHDTFILGTENNLETSATLRSRSLYRKHEQKDGGKEDNKEVGRSQSVAVTMASKPNQIKKHSEIPQIKSTERITSKGGLKQQDSNHSEINKKSKMKRRGSKRVSSNKSKTSSEKNKNEDDISRKNIEDEEVDIIRDKEEDEKRSVKVENINIEEKYLQKSQINEIPISEDEKEQIKEQGTQKLDEPSLKAYDNYILKKEEKIDGDKVNKDLNKSLEKNPEDSESTLDNKVKEKEEMQENEMLDEENSGIVMEIIEYLDKEENKIHEVDRSDECGEKEIHLFESEAKARLEEAIEISDIEKEKIFPKEGNKATKISDEEDKSRISGEPVIVREDKNLEEKRKSEEINISDEANKKEADKHGANLFIGILEDEDNKKIKPIIENEDVLLGDKSYSDETNTYEVEKLQENNYGSGKDDIPNLKSSVEDTEDVFISEIHEKLMEETPKLDRHQNLSLDEDVRITGNEEHKIIKDELMFEEIPSIDVLNEESFGKNMLQVNPGDHTANSTMSDVENGVSSEDITKVLSFLNFAPCNILMNCQDLNIKGSRIVDICKTTCEKFREEISHIAISDDITNNFGYIADCISSLVASECEVIVTSSECLDLAVAGCIAYMIKYKGIKLAPAYNFIKQQRPLFTIDSEIMNKLEDWSNVLIQSDAKFDKFIHDERLITNVFSHLNLANFTALGDEEMKKFRITSVIEISRNGDKDADDSLSIVSADGVDSFGDIADKIHSLVSAGGEVVVACDEGAALAGSACIAYLVKYQNIPVEKAISILQQNRPCLSMDKNIISKLIQWENNSKPQKQTDIQEICPKLNVANNDILQNDLLAKNGLTSLVEICSSVSVGNCMDIESVLFNDDIVNDFGDIADAINKFVANGNQVVVTSEKSFDLSVSACIAYLVKHQDSTVEQAIQNICENNTKLSLDPDIQTKLLSWEQLLSKNRRNIITEQQNKSNITQIFDNLNIGNCDSVNYEEKLKEHAINSVVRMGSSASYTNTSDIQTVLFENDTISNFDDVADCIDLLITEGGNVAVIWDENVCLSICACVAYLSKYQGFTVNQAVDHIKNKKINASLQQNIVENLIKWQQLLIEKKKESKIIEIFNHLNIVDYASVLNDKDSLTKKSITSVIEISSYPSALSDTDDIQSVKLNHDIADNFDDVADKIHGLKKEGQNIVVMSDENLDLAVSACVAYLIKYQGFGVIEALNTISGKNPHIGIDKILIEKLQQWQIFLQEKAGLITITDISNNLKAVDFSANNDLDALVQNSGSYVLEISLFPTKLDCGDNHGVFFTNDITQDFGNVADSIDALFLENKNVIVASDKGESVSACIAYMVKYQDMSVEEAINSINQNDIIDESTKEKLQKCKVTCSKYEDKQSPIITTVFNNLNITTNNILEDSNIFNNFQIESVIELTSNPSESKLVDCGADIVSLNKNILEDLDGVAYTIAQLVETGGKVVVTCDENVGLAASACLAYLAVYEGIQVRNMANTINQIRPDVIFQENILQTIENWFHELKLQEEEEMAKKLATEQLLEIKNQTLTNNNITEIYSNLSMSNFEALQDTECIKKQKISSVMEISSSPTSCLRDYNDPLSIGSVVIADDVIENFELIADKIDILTSTGEYVLVTCDTAEELAACVCIAYLVKYQGHQVNQAIFNISQKRQDITISDHIINKLTDWEKLRNKIDMTDELIGERESLVTEVFNYLSIGNHKFQDTKTNKEQSSTSSNDVQVMAVNSEDVYWDFCCIADKIKDLANSGIQVIVKPKSGETSDVAATACIAYAVKYLAIEVDDAVDIIQQKTNVNIANDIISELYKWKVNLDQEGKIREICCNLYVAGYSCLGNTERLSNQDITAVVEMTSSPSVQNTCKLKAVAVTNDVTNDFGEVVNIINDLIQEGRQVVISCDKGITVAIVACIAYLVKFKTLTVDEAVKTIQQNISEINIDEYLLNILNELEKESQKVLEESERKEDDNKKNIALKEALEEVEGTEEERNHNLALEEANRQKEKQELKLSMEETEKKEAEEWKQKLALEEAQRKEEEKKQKLALAESERIEEERKQKLAQEEAQRNEEERKHKLALAEAERIEEERKQKLSLEEAQRKEEERKQKLALAEAARIEEEIKLKLSLEEAQRKEEERKQKLALAEAERIEEARKQKLALEEAQRKEEEKRQALAIEEAKRREEEKRQNLIEEAKRKLKAEERRQKLEAEESKRKFEEQERTRKLAELEESRITEIFSNLSLSNYRALNDVEVLKKHGVNFVIEINRNPHPKNNIESLNITIPEAIAKDFDLIADTINSLVSSGKYILVSGHGGCSDCSAACMAYMIKYHGLRARKAAQTIQGVRPNTVIDIRTISQLEDWQWKLRQQKIKQRFRAIIQTIKGHYHPAYIPCILTMIIIYFAYKMFQEKVEDEYRRFVKLPRDQNIDPYNYFDIKKWP